MATFTIPDPDDAKDTISDCLTVLDIAVAGASRREQIVDNCIAPVSLLFKAGEMINAAGPEEEAVFAYFLAVLRSQLKLQRSHTEECVTLTAPHRVQ